MQLQGRDLAGRLGVSPARVSVLEHDEPRGAVTLRMMERAARALGCEFVYALVPVDRGGASHGRHKRKLRLDSGYQARSAEQQREDLEARLRQAEPNDGSADV
jgi:transcriptional regulator with XRE-family HTH domain